jgi:hypothetical protein
MMHPYASAEYAAAFCHQGMQSFYLSQAQTHVLLRNIPGTDEQDAMGGYPLCPFAASAHFEEDFHALAAAGAITLVAVTDTFFRPDEAMLHQTFDRCTAYKPHYVLNLQDDSFHYGKHHRYEIRRAYRFCEVRPVLLANHLKEWIALYRILVEKHHITGIQNFPDAYFEAIATLPGLTTLAAFIEGRMVSAHLWLEHEGYVYSHLAASSEEGYQARSAYAIYDATIEHFRSRNALKIDFGGGAGVNSPSQGLTFFKQGFSSETLPVFLCGKILRPDRYATLSGGSETSFFPAYRAPK